MGAYGSGSIIRAKFIHYGYDLSLYGYRFWDMLVYKAVSRDGFDVFYILWSPRADIYRVEDRVEEIYY